MSIGADIEPVLRTHYPQHFILETLFGVIFAIANVITVAYFDIVRLPKAAPRFSRRVGGVLGVVGPFGGLPTVLPDFVVAACTNSRLLVLNPVGRNHSLPRRYGTCW